MTDKTTYPYDIISFISVAVGGSRFSGSGVLISPDEVLTASHLVLSQGVAATDIRVFPGTDFTQGAAGEIDGVYAHALATGAGADTISYDQSQSDFAVIHLAHPVNEGTMSLLANFHGGSATVSGYPGTDFAQDDTVQEVTQDQKFTLLHGTTLGPGSSGGPVWITGSNGQAEVVGVVSSESTDTTLATFAQITPGILNLLSTWVAQDDVTQPLVDPTQYYAANPDVLAADTGAAFHYEDFGWHEGRNPDAYFSTVGYLASNPDVAAAGVDPAVHYDISGWREGRDPSATFDTRLYLLHNPDVAAAGIDPLAHYLAYGQGEGRATYAAVGPTIVGGFDREYYLLANPDVARAGVDPYTHYETYGWHEGRKPDAVFDPSYYLSHNADVAAAGIDPLLHYDLFGWHEGRDPSATFSTSAYLAHAPDVAAAGIDPLEHYLQYGIYEGRAIT